VDPAVERPQATAEDPLAVQALAGQQAAVPALERVPGGRRALVAQALPVVELAAVLGVAAAADNKCAVRPSIGSAYW
jgi:hypothetical protein